MTFSTRTIAAVAAATLSLTMFSYAAAASSVQRRKATPRAKSPSAKVAYARGDFDPSVDRLPPDYHGHDPRAVYAELASVLVPKGEFETTAAFDARAAAARAGLGSRRYAFVLDIDPTGIGVGASYDADRGIQHVHESLSGGDLVVASDTVKGDFYRATNAFGVAVTVYEAETEEYRLVLSPPILGRRRGAPVDAVLEITPYNGLWLELAAPVPVEAARADKGRLGLLVVGRAAPPSWSYDATLADTRSTSPTMDSPERITTKTRGVYFSIEELWLFNRSTGEVRAKADAVSVEDDLAGPGIDPSATKLDGRFVGDDPAALYAACDRVIPWSDSVGRERDPLRARFVDHLFARRYAFRMPSDRVSISRDPGSGEVVVTFPTIALRGGSPIEKSDAHPAIEIPRSGLIDSTFLVFPDAVVTGPSALVARATIPPNADQGRSRRLGAVLLARLSDAVPARQVADASWVAAVDDYVDSGAKRIALAAEGIWVVDLDTGEVLAKTKPGFEASMRRRR